MDFKEIKFKDTKIQIIDGDRGKNYPKKNEMFGKGHTLFLNNKNIINDYLDVSHGEYITEEKCNSLRKGKLNRNDIVMSTRGSVGNIGFFSDSIVNEHIRINSGMVIFRNEDENIDTTFLYHLLKSDLMKNRYKEMISGSVQNQLPIRDIENINLTLPPINTQIKIAKILQLIEEKIFINSNIIRNIESITNTIVESWFIDFEFPNEQGLPYHSSGGEMVESELGEIPKLFETKELSSICEVKDGTHDSPKQAIAGFPLVTSKHLMDNSIDFSSAKLISKEDYEKVNKRSQVNTNDILISMIGTVGKLYLVHDKEINFAIKNIGLIKTSQIKDYEYILGYFKSNFMQNYIKERTTGSTQQYISLTELRKIPVLVPNEQALARYKRVVKLFYEMIAVIIVENQRLVLLRDSLLPKLLNGEIEIPDESVVERS